MSDSDITIEPTAPRTKQPVAPGSARKTAASKISAPEPDNKEPKQPSVAVAASAEPAAASPTPYAAVSGKGADSIVYSQAKPADRNGARRSLTVYHLQRKLWELGFKEGYSETRYAALTQRSVAQWQHSRKYKPTGTLTREQFTELFKDDVNVSAAVDTAADHPADRIEF